jgi:hypothetical protein
MCKPWMIIAIFTLLVTAAWSQIPAESSKATVINRVGLQDVTIEYSRPNVDGRVIWGGLVPYGQVWRTGANYPTFISLTDSILVEGAFLAPGKYALYTIPGPEKWIIIFSSNTELWGAYGYDPKDDVMRVTVRPEPCEFTETFTIFFSNVRADDATLNLQWAEVRVPILISANSLAAVKARVEEELSKEEPAWGIFFRAAEYMLNHEKDLTLATQWIDRSLEIEENWMNLWTKALIVAERGELTVAVNYGERALKICLEDTVYCPYENVYRLQVEGWKTR